MKIHLLGVPMDLGAGRRCVDMGPSAIRIAGIAEKLRSLGHAVRDEGDIPTKAPELQRIRNNKLRYLPEIVRACTVLARKVEKILRSEGFPLILGGDHSVAIGSIAGVASCAVKTRKRLGVLWIDAHGDFNTERSTPSGNVHGMPLAAMVGLGATELTSVGGDFRKVDPKHVVLIGTRDLDDGERKNIKQSGVSVFSMEEIDKHGKMTSFEVVEVNPILDNRNQSAEFAVELVQSAFGKRII